MKRPKVILIKNFLPEEVCKELTEWVKLGVTNKWLDNGLGTDFGYRSATRFTTRAYGDRFEYPQVVYDTYAKIRTYLSIPHLRTSYAGGGKSGVVVSCTLPGGDVFPHIDPKEPWGHVLRCNVLTQAADAGGELFIGGEKIEVGVGDLHCYLPSTVVHHVTEVKGETPRILWMFGFQIRLDEFNAIADNYPTI